MKQRSTITYLLLWIFIALYSAQCNAQFIISEVMISNRSYLDSENDLPESWIELYNTTDQPLSLYEYQLTCEKHNHFLFSIDTTIAPKSYIIIPCDEKDYDLHTNFKLPYTKDFDLTLLSPANEIISLLTIPEKKQNDISYGIDSLNRQGWMLPTPMADNTSIYTQFLQQPTLSKQSGIYHQPFTVNLVANSKESVTYYTTNGSIPTEKDSIFADKMQIKETTVIQLRSFADNHIPSEVSAYTFLFPDHDITLPVMSIITDEENLYDEKRGIYVEGSFNDTFNFAHNWHRPIHIDYMDTQGNLLLNQPAEMRIAGATSRFHPQKSLAIYSKKRCSGDDFTYPFWEEKPHVKSTHSFQLRNAGNDFLIAHLRDAIVQTYIGKTLPHLDYQAYQPVITYINGKYNGLMNLRERTNEDYLSSNYGIDNVDIIENWFSLSKGTWSDAIHLYNVLNHKNLSYQDLDSLIDMNQFMDYFIAETYFGNADYPDNNIVMWKEKKEGAKWRWILKDLDMTLDYQFTRTDPPTFSTTNFFDQILNEDYVTQTSLMLSFPSKLMRKLSRMEPFKEPFIDRLTIYMGDFLHPRYILPHIDSLANKIEYEFPFTYNLYADYRKDDYAEWYREINIIKESVSKRNWVNIASLQTFYGLGDPFHIIINDPFEKDLPYTLTINDIPLIHTSYEGYYFKNRKMVIRAKPKGESTPINVWEITKTTSDATAIGYLFNDSIVIQIPPEEDVTSIQIKMITNWDEIKPQQETAYYTVLKGGIQLYNLSKHTQISLHDLLGRLIWSGDGSTHDNYFLPIGHEGCYILTINSETHKIIIP